MKLRHYFISTYIGIAATGILIATGHISITWLEFLSPFIIGLAALIIYAGVMILLSNIKQKQLVTYLEKETEVSEFCHGCAKPLPEPLRHRKGESVFHLTCKPN